MRRSSFTRYMVREEFILDEKRYRKKLKKFLK